MIYHFMLIQLLEFLMTELELLQRRVHTYENITESYAEDISITCAHLE